MDTSKKSVEIDGVMYLNAEWVRERILAVADDLNDWAYQEPVKTEIEKEAVKLSKNGKRLGPLTSWGAHTPKRAKG